MRGWERRRMGIQDHKGLGIANSQGMLVEGISGD